MKSLKGMFSVAMAAAGVMLTLAFAQPAVAQTVTIGDAGTGDTAGFTSMSERGQFFIVPAGMSRLTDVKIGTVGVGDFDVALRRVVGGAPDMSGAALASVTFPTSPHDLLRYKLLGPVVPAAGIPVTPGEQLYIGVSTGTIALATDYYPGGGVTGHGARDAYFTATFAVSSPVAVPTMSEWALILLGVMLAGGAALMIQRRRTA